MLILWIFMMVLFWSRVVDVDFYSFAMVMIKR